MIEDISKIRYWPLAWGVLFGVALLINVLGLLKNYHIARDSVADQNSTVESVLPVRPDNSDKTGQIQVLRETLARLQTELALRESDLKALEGREDPGYQETLESARNAARREYLLEYPAYMGGLMAAERATNELAEENAKIQVMRSYGIYLAQMGLEPERLDGLLSELNQRQYSFNASATQSVAAGNTSSLNVTLSPMQLLAESLSTDELQAFRKAQAEHAQQTGNYLLKSSLVKNAPDMGRETLKKVLQTYIKMTPPVSDNPIDAIEGRLNRFQEIRDEFEDQYSGDDWKGIERFLNEQEISLRRTVEMSRILTLPAR